MKEGDIIFLTRRKYKPYYRIFISCGIALVTRKKGQTYDDVKVHSAIIYKYKGVLFVREMEKHGDEHSTLEKYKEIYGGRMEIKESPVHFSVSKYNSFNRSCRELHVEYDYNNTFVYQILRKVFKFFRFKNTVMQRMCAEDAQRQYNLLSPGFFKTPEKTSPNELYYKILNWKTVKF